MPLPWDNNTGLYRTNVVDDVMTVAVTIGATATDINRLVNTALTDAGYTPAMLLSAKLLAYRETGVDRDPVLYGGNGSQLGYIPAGAEAAWAGRLGTVCLKRFGVSDVEAILELLIRSG